MNNFFDKIYCINLKHRTDRRERAQKQFDQYKLDVEFVEAYNGNNYRNDFPISNGNFGLILTVEKILKDAMANDYNRILILEDDVEISEEITKFHEQITDLPLDWTLLYFGANHNTHAGSELPIFINNTFSKIHNSYTTHAVGMTRKGMELIHERFNTAPIHEIDVMYAEIQKEHPCYCFNELLMTQASDFSDIENKVVNYNNLITKIR